jgi:Uma2 family endonuclease
MPGAVLPEVRLAEDQAPRKKITRQEAQFLADNGFLTTRWELLDGEIVLKMPQNAPHRITLFLIAVWLEQVFGRPFVVTQQGVEVRKADQTTNYPEPDVSVLTRPAPEFTQGDPTAAETHC